MDTRLDDLAKKHTGADTFEALLAREEAPWLPSSRNAARRDEGARGLRELADAYDRAQAERGSPLRADRGW